jgi:putative hydrolase of the HAD superfamily
LNKKFSFFFLDLDDTLYAYDVCHEAGLEGFVNFAEANFNLTREVILAGYKSARKTINSRLAGFATSHSRLLYAKEFCEAFKINPVLFSLPLEKSYWDGFLSKMVLREDALLFLNRIKESGCKLALVTDLTTEIQLRKLAYLKIGDLFDVIVTSEEAGKEKPAAEIFDLAFKKLNAQKPSSVMIGDNYEKDVLGARAYGISAFYFGSKEGEPQSINSFTEAIQLFL